MNPSQRFGQATDNSKEGSATPGGNLLMDSLWTDVLPLVISVVAITLSLTTFYLARKFQQSDRKKSLTIQLWRNWEEDTLRTQRVSLWEVITDDEHRKIPPLKSVEIENLSQRSIKALNDIEHFLDGVGKLREGGELDEALFHSLFDENVSHWRDISASINRTNDDMMRSTELSRAIYKRLT